MLRILNNLGGIFTHISLQAGMLCKMIAKVIKESTNLTLTYSSGDNLLDYRIYGYSEQDGTPTPTNPVEVESCGDDGDIEVTVSDGTNSTTTTIDLTGHEPLRKIGDVADYIDYKRRKIVRNIGVQELPTTGWTYRSSQSSGASYYYQKYLSPDLYPESAVYDNSISNILKADVAWNNVDGVNIYYHQKSNGMFMIRIDKNTIDSLTETPANGLDILFTNLVSLGTNLLVYRTLTPPTEEDITLPTIDTYEGTNTITFGETIEPSSMYVKYYGTE